VSRTPPRTRTAGDPYHPTMIILGLQPWASASPRPWMHARYELSLRAQPRTMTLQSRRPPPLILSTSVQSTAVDFDDGIGERLRSFLRQVVPDATGNGPVRISAREFIGIGARPAVGIAQGDCWERDNRGAARRPCGTACGCPRPS
jgi:hypothetical protein